MYSTCLFCHTSLARNEVLETLPVGRRIAFDAHKGRLWIVCRKCERWNLTPIEERWEAIEDCERRFRGTRVRVQTTNIGLAKLREGLELVRIGKPLRPEFAAWRYGDQFGRRRRRAVAVGSVGVAAAIAVAPTAAAAYSLGGVLLAPLVGPSWSIPYSIVKEYVTRDRVVARIPTPEGRATVRVRHLKDATLVVERSSDEVSLDLLHDGGRTYLTGEAAHRTIGTILTHSNVLGGSSSQVQEAVRRIDAVGDAARYFVSASRLSRRPGGRVMAQMRGVGPLNLTYVERLALEMALHEASERRVLEGELDKLAVAWREAEEIASIADEL